MLPILALPTLALPARLVLTPSMVVNETALGDASFLVDEPDAVGDPASGKGGAPSRPFFPGWTAWQYPVHVAIDLGSDCQVDRMFVYHEKGNDPISVSFGRPFHWQSKAIALDGYRRWVEIPVGARTRWLRLTLNRPTSIPEIAVYGARLTPVATPKPPLKRRPLPTMDALIGTNAFIDDPIDKIAPPSGLLREYHPWLWDVENGDRKTRFQPSAAAGGNAWFFDDYYAKLKAAGVTVSPVVWQAPDWMFGHKSREAKPVEKSADPQDPASYARHAAHLFQYAARYGSRKVADGLLDLAPGQPRRSGLGLLRYLENWNEPDKTWEGRESRFDPYDLAAMSSADYDGHRGKLGKGHGVKVADPSMRLVMGGLVGLNLDFVRAVKLWADEYRGGDFPADAINVHHYSSTAGEQGWISGTTALSPEADGLKEKLETLTEWRDRNAPGRELWLTEFGYDTHEGSPIYARPVGKMTAEEVQAAWLVRGYLAAAAARVDRAAMFMLRDTDSNGTGVFSSSGLVGEKGSWAPKTSWYYVSALRRHLRGMRFAAEIPSGRADVSIYRFDGPKSTAYAVWCPTSEDKRVSNHKLRLPSGPRRQVTFVKGRTKGITRPLPPIPTVSIDVSETPTLVIVG